MKPINYSFNILDKQINILTNSSFFKTIVRDAFFSLKKGAKPSLDITCILKGPRDLREIIYSISDIATTVVDDMQGEYWIFHGSALCRNNQATLFLGEPSSGKSSLCFASGLWGAKIISDEPVLVNKKSYTVMPFHYILKIKYFFQNFSDWNFYSKNNISKYRYTVKKRDYNFIVFTKRYMNKLGIRFADTEVPLKNIIFLEDKKYDAVLHLSKHCLNKEKKIQSIFDSFNRLIHGKRVEFLPRAVGQLKDEKTAKSMFVQIFNT